MREYLPTWEDTAYRQTAERVMRCPSASVEYLQCGKFSGDDAWVRTDMNMDGNDKIEHILGHMLCLKQRKSICKFLKI